MKKRFKIRYKRLVLFLIIILILVLIGVKIFSLKISNIYIIGNKYLSDQIVIELAGIADYPRAITILSNNLENKIRKSDYVKDVKVNKKGLTRVYILVEENRPLIYDEVDKKTVLKDGTKVDKIVDVPILVNSIDSDIYMEFLEKLASISDEVFANISEIEYTPNDVDKELFLFTMKDANYISVNLNKFSSVNKYLDIVKQFNNKKGILYLDSGEYFKILNN